MLHRLTVEAVIYAYQKFRRKQVSRSLGVQIEKHDGAHDRHMDALNFVKMTSKHRTLVHEKLQRQVCLRVHITQLH